MSRLHLNAFEFYDTTPVEFYQALKDRKKLDEMQLNFIERSIYDSMRLQTMLIHNMSPYHKKTYKEPQKYLKFAWDKKQPVKVQTLKEMKQALMKLEAWYKKKGKK